MKTIILLMLCAALSACATTPQLTVKCTVGVNHEQ